MIHTSHITPARQRASLNTSSYPKKILLTELVNTKATCLSHQPQVFLYFRACKKGKKDGA